LGFLFGLFFDPEDGGSMFLWNTGELLLDNKTLHPRRWHYCTRTLRYKYWNPFTSSQILTCRQPWQTPYAQCCTFSLWTYQTETCMEHHNNNSVQDSVLILAHIHLVWTNVLQLALLPRQRQADNCKDVIIDVPSNEPDHYLVVITEMFLTPREKFLELYCAPDIEVIKQCLRSLIQTDS
jgi:hypothetical protein